jgi:hypothetical protein
MGCSSKQNRLIGVTGISSIDTSGPFMGTVTVNGSFFGTSVSSPYKLRTSDIRHPTSIFRGDYE